MPVVKIVVLTLFLMSLPSAAMPQQKYALLVGISNYHALDKNNEWDDIHGANDINLISPELKKQGFRIQTLLDAQATHARIVTELQQMAKTATPGSIVYLHFSMHGQPFDDALSPVKDDEVWDESLVPIDAMIAYDEKYKGQNHLVDDELNQYSEAIRTKIGKSGMLYVAIDACHAGGASKSINDKTRGTKRGFTNKVDKRFRPSDERPAYFTLSTNPDQSPVVYLEACQGKQVNTEMKFDGKYHGPMSYFIVQTICNTKIDRDAGWVNQVKMLMNQKGPQNQQMVIEKSRE